MDASPSARQVRWPDREVAMPLDAPFRLGPFIVDADGRLSPGTPEPFPSFRVAWRGHVVAGDA